MTPPPRTGPPETCAVAFKEWAGICAALTDGRQSLILRKGGIAEGPGGFRPEHAAFWLYPTRIHEAEQGLREASESRLIRPADDDRVEFRALAVVRSIDRVADLPALERLEAEHIWAADTIARRFHYRSPGLWVLGVRIYLVERPVAIAVTAEHVGCKTWVPLDRPIAVERPSPVLDDSADEAAATRVRSALEPAELGRART